MSTNYNPFEGGNQQQSENDNPFSGDSTFTGGNDQYFTQRDFKAIDYDEEEKKKSIYEIGREYFDALNTGVQTGFVAEEYLEVFKGNHSPEAIEAMVKAGERLNSLPQNDRMAKYVKAVDDAGGGLWNGIIELANTDGALVASQVALQSLAMMATGVLDSGGDILQGKTPDVIGYMAAGAGVGAATFGAIGTIAPGLGNLIGAGGGAIAGAMGGLSTALENGLTFTEMMKEKIEAAGGEYNKESIKAFLEDDDKYDEVRNDALKRGLTIGAVDMLTGGIAGAVGVKTATKLGRSVLGPRVAKGVGILTGTGVEGLGGGIGEAAGQVAGGQEFNAADIILEAFAEMPGAGVTVVPKVLLNKPKYTITENKKEIEYTREQFLEQIDGLNDESIAILDMKIDNDPALAEELFNRQNDFILDSRVDDRVSDPNDRAKLVALEKQRQKLEKQSKLTGLRKKPRAKEQLENVEAQMEEIIDGYSGVDRRSSAVRKRKQTRKNVNEGRTKILMERITKGVVESKAYQNMDISIDQVQSDTGAQMRLDQEEKNAMYDIGLLEAEKVNIENDDTLPLEQRVKELNQINAEIQAIEDGVNEVRNNMNEARDSHGFLLEDSESGKMKIVINEDKAIADGSGNINVAAHEFLHAVLNKSFNSKSNNYAVRSPRGLGGTVGGALFQYMKTLDPNIASNRFMSRLLSYSANEEAMGQEVLNLMSDSLVDGSFNPDDTVLNKIGDMFATFFESVGLKEIKFGEAKDVYRFVKNFNKSIQGSKMAGRVVQRAAKQGEELFDTKPAENVSGKTESPMSKDVFADKEVVEDLGLKQETISIVAKNAAIEAAIIRENIRDKDGNVMASPALQRELAKNNIPRAFALARQAANRGNDLTLEEGLKINSVQDFFSEYSLKLVELARTYRAVKDGKQVPFGAYMNTLLPKKYAGILDKLKSKIETSSMSNEVTAKAVGKKSSSLGKMASTEVEGRTVAMESIDQQNTQKELVRLVIENDTKLYKYKDVKSELTAHRKFMKDGTEITPELKAQYKKDGKKPPKELKSLREPIGRLYSGLEAVSEIFGKDLAIRIIKEQDLTTEQRKAIQDKILKYFPQIISMMPFGTTASGDATGVANTGLKAFYKKLSRTKMKDTGVGKGNYLQQKQYINPNIFKEMAGLVPGARVNNTSVDGFLRAVVVQVASIANNQAIRQAHGTEVIALKDGKASTMFSNKAKKKSKATTDNVEKGLTSKIQQKENGSWPSIAEIHEQVMVEMNTEFGRYELEQWLFEGNGKEYLTKAFLTNSGNFTGTTKRSVDANGNKVRLHSRNLLYRNVKEIQEKVELELNKQALIQHKVEFDKLSAEQKVGVENAVFPADAKYNEQELKDIANVFKKISQTEKNFADTELKESKARGFKLLWESFDQMIEDNPANGRYILALLSSSSSQQRAFMRTGSIFGFTNTLNETSIEEHTLAASDFAKFLYNRLMERNLFGDLNFFDKAVQSYFQGPLPLRMDNNLVGPGFTYKDNAGKYSWDVFMGLKPIWIRYINPDVSGNKGGVDPNVIKLSSGNTLAEEYGVGIPKALRTEAVVAKQQELLFNIFNEVNIEKRNKLIATAGKAINNFAKVKLKKGIKTTTKIAKQKSMASKPPKGISVLDFDDTLATTKSGVRAKIPNPDGSPKPKRKVIFLAGGAGSGKGNVISKLGLEDQGFKVVNSDISLEWLKKNSGLPASMNDFTKEQRSKLGSLQHQARGIAKRKMTKYKGNADGVVVDGTGGSINSMEKLVNEFKDKGYDVSMLFVETSLPVALQRNAARKERSLLDKIVTKNHEAVQGNKDGFKAMFGNRFMEVNTDNLSQQDAMPSKLTNEMNDFVSSYENRRLNAEEFASEGADILDQGGRFDFSEFNKVVEGQTAPLFNKAMKLQDKFGGKDMFVLTARPAESAPAIFEFLKANGLNIPLQNITGLANSTSEAKALWMADKVAEGYNDFYFADDALQNVQAVQNMLDQFDVKSKVQQAKVKFSQGLSENFNDILENVTGIESKKRFSAIKARKRGSDKGKFRLFIPPSHEDFVGLLYNFLGKGKEGNAQMRFFEDALIKPLNRGYKEIDTAKQAIANDYKSLNKEFADVKAKFREKTPDGDFTYQDAVRVYLWNKHGHDVPGLSPTDKQGLVDLVMEDSELQTYAETLNVISKQDTYINPTEGWEGGDIRMDLMDATGRVGRAQYFTEFNENAEAIFDEDNMNKIEAAYGSNFRSALEDMLHRIKTGVNRPKGQSATVNKFMNYLNGSVGSVMFLNMRSAALQQMSIVNYLNFADNNIVSAAAAFANQPQYWKDFSMIFNSDMLKQRRGGIGNDVNGAELAEAVSKSRNPMGSVIGKLLQLGFTPTQIGDSIAIAAGGSTYYRNRVKKYLKDGLNVKDAEAAAFTDFQDITQSTQQSARPDMTSQQQASWIGKVVLNFQNITSQYNRLIKKAGSDIYNRRITSPNSSQMQSDMSNASRILYYGAVQNVVFYSLQTALFALMFGTDDEEDDKKADQVLKKKERVIQGTIDSLLRGSGIYGAIVSTLKNMAIKWNEQREKKYNPDESAVIMEMLNFSPVVGIKARKMVNAEKTLNYNKKVIKEMETFDIDNPMWSAVTNYIEATTNAPVNRLYQKTINVRNALDNQYTAFQRAMFLFGYTTWSLNLGDTEKMKDVKEKVKTNKKKKKKTVKNPWATNKKSKKIKSPW